MKKLLLLLFVFISLNAQDIRFCWISNLSSVENENISSDSLITIINSLGNIEFVVFTGNLTKNHKHSEFESVQKSLDNLEHPYYIIPASDELKDDLGLSFREFWYDLEFSYESGNCQFIGITAKNFLNDKKDDFSQESLSWLNDQLIPDKYKILFFDEGLFENTRNWQNVIAPLTEQNLSVIFSHNTESPKTLESLFLYPFSKKDEKKKDEFNFYTGTISGDTLTMSNWQHITEPLAIRELALTADSLKYESLSPELGKYELVFHNKFNSTLIADPLIYEDKIIVCEKTGIVSALDTLGNVIWDNDVFGDIVGTPIVADEKLIVPTLQGDIIILNLETGENIQSIGFSESITSDLLAIEYEGTERLLIPKQTTSTTAIVFGTTAGKIHCYDLETLQKYWVCEDMKELIHGELQYSDSRILAKSNRGNLYCIDAKRGWLIWRWNERTKKNPTIYDYATLLHEKMVYAASTSGHVFGIDLMLGKTEWKSDRFRDCNSIALSPNEKNLLVKVYNNKLILVSQKTGTNLNVLHYNNGYDNAFGTLLTKGNDMFMTNGSGEIYKADNFKRAEKILALNSGLLSSLQFFANDMMLISTINGDLYLVKPTEE